VQAVTDDSGCFMIDSMEKGTFRIEVNDKHACAAIMEVAVDSSSITVEDTLHPYATIKGNAGGGAGAPEKRCVLVYGLNRRIAIDDSGSFSAQDLPAGTFHFRIVSGNGMTAPIDIDSVIARPNDTVLLPFAGWTKSAEITLNTAADGGADIPGDVYGFPVLLRLTKSNFHFDQAAGSGSDCRFAKADGTPLAFEIEQWDSAKGLASIWVRVDTVLGMNGTQSFTMYWSNPRASPVIGGKTVFDTADGFLAAYHLSGNVNDATINGFNGKDNGTTPATDGVIAGGRSFNGSSQYISAGDLPDRQSGTISFWMRPKATINSSTSATQGIWGKKSSDSLDFFLSIRGGGDFWPRPGGTEGGCAGTIFSKLETPDTGYYLSSSTASFQAGIWCHVAWTWGAEGNRIYINGKLENSDTNSLPVYGDGADEIGRTCYDVSNIVNGGPLYFNGTLDEFRMDNRSRGADWIKLCYINQLQDDKFVIIKSR
jgi:hypothetical protein